MSTSTAGRRPGWITFAGVVAIVAGFYNGLSGLSVITSNYQGIEQIHQVLFGINVSAWGWVWLIVGIAQAFTGYLILVRNSWGMFFGVALAGLSAMVALFAIFAWPLWAIAVLTLDLLVMYGLLTHIDSFD